jgi:membrane associated rhomboid family serine protease
MSDPNDPLQPDSSIHSTQTDAPIPAVAPNTASTATASGAATPQPAKPNSAKLILHGMILCPVTGAVILLAIAVSLAWWAKLDVSWFLDSAGIQRGQVWRLFTDIFPHVNVIHLFFNLSWIWAFGIVVERSFGHWKTALLIVLFAVVSSGAQFALSGQGVGLSGVGYAYFGMLWMLSRKDPRYAMVMQKQTVNLFLGWFVLCVVLSLAHIWNVGNLAHGAGALVGVLVGLAITDPPKRTVYATAVAVLTVAVLWGATYGRPLINFSDAYAYDQFQLGYSALKDGNPQDAVHYLSDAAKRVPTEPVFFYDLGVAYDKIGNTTEADKAYSTAHALKPDDAHYAAAANRSKANSVAEPSDSN